MTPKDFRRAVAMGLYKITVSPVEFKKPVRNGMTSGGNPVTLWEARLSNLMRSMPDHTAHREDPAEALAAAVESFNQQRLPQNHKTAGTSQKPAPSKAELDAIEDLI